MDPQRNPERCIERGPRSADRTGATRLAGSALVARIGARETAGRNAGLGRRCAG